MNYLWYSSLYAVKLAAVLSKEHELSFILSGFERMTVWGWWDSGSVQGLGSESSFRPSLTKRRGGPGMKGGGSSYSDSKPMACVCEGAGERERGVRVLTVKWWAVLVHRWATAGRVRVGGSLPALARLLPVCPPRPTRLKYQQISLSLSASLLLFLCN